MNKNCNNLQSDKTVLYLMITAALLLLIMFVIWGLWSQSRQSKKLNATRQQPPNAPRDSRYSSHNRR